jgi:kynurenine formamidase
MSVGNESAATGRRAFLAAGLSLLGCAAARFAAASPKTPVSPVPAAPGRLSEAQFIALTERVSNWGRWGKTDTLGAVNLITPATIRRAQAEIREGITVSCGAPIPSSVPGGVDHSGELSLWIDAADQWGAVNDRITLVPHGRNGVTHIDALAHVYYRGKHYNGVPFTGVVGNRVESMSIDSVDRGFTGRGVLIDLPAAVGKEWLEPSDRLSPTELRRAIEAAGTRLTPGDILIFNTGVHALKRAQGGNSSASVATGGMQIECVEMIHAADPALIISDAGMDTLPGEVDSVLIPWHIACVVMMGVQLVDNAALGELLATCRRLKRSSFFCTVAPVAYVGATASPVNPICVF